MPPSTRCNIHYVVTFRMASIPPERRAMNEHLKTMRIHLIGISVLAVCLLGSYFAGVRPVVHADQRLQQIALEGEWLQGILPQMELEVEELTFQLKDKRSVLAAKYSVVTPSNSPLIGVATDLLQRHQIALVNLRETANGGGDVSLALQVTAAYEDLIRFLQDLGQLDRPVQISSLNLAPEDDHAARFNVAITLKFPAAPVPPSAPSQIE